MKLYSHIDRVHREIAELGKASDAPLSAAEVSAFDQLHYHGTDAVDHGIVAAGITAASRVLEIGSGFGGPARHMATAAGARITALELQPDQHALAIDLTNRCGLADRIEHLCGDFLEQPWGDRQFDAIVSWLAIYHIPDRGRLLSISRELLPVGGLFYTEDLFARAPLSGADREELESGLFAIHLPPLKQYRQEFQDAGFDIVGLDDMSTDWTDFTTERLAAYRASRERQLRVHGEPTYRAMEAFYSIVHRYFAAGKLGGLRLLAKRLS